jgi:hypothetical protein
LTDWSPGGCDLEGRSVTLHSSWRTVAGGYVGPLILLLITAFAVQRAGIGPIAVALAVFSLVLVAILLFDFPVATRFDETGLVRRMPLRRHRLAWDDVERLSRARGKVLDPRRLTDRANRGGLVAVVGRRRYLLVDQAESRREFELLAAVLEHAAPWLVNEGLVPPEHAPPTYLYRRRKWRPERGPGR